MFSFQTMRFSLKFLEEKGHCQYIVFFISVQKLAWVGLNEGDWEKRFIEQQLKSANSPIKQSLTLRGCHPAGPANKPDILPDNKPYHKPVNKPDILPDWRWWGRLTTRNPKMLLIIQQFCHFISSKDIVHRTFLLSRCRLDPWQVCCWLTWEGRCPAEERVGTSIAKSTVLRHNMQTVKQAAAPASCGWHQFCHPQCQDWTGLYCAM